LRSADTRGAQVKAAAGVKSRDAQVTVTQIPDGRGDHQKMQEGTTESRREEADRQVIERGEDDGMTVPQRVTSSVPGKGHPIPSQNGNGGRR